MPYCSKCGTKLRAKSKFCPGCGTRIIAEEPKPAKTEVAKVKREIDPRTSNMILYLTLGTLLIVIGFCSRYLANVFAKGRVDALVYYSLGDWLLALFVIAGVFVICYGIVDYAITRKKLEPRKKTTHLIDGISLILAGFLIRMLLANVIAEKIKISSKTIYPDTIISIGDLLLIFLAIAGIIVIGFWIVKYAVARRKRK